MKPERFEPIKETKISPAFYEPKEKLTTECAPRVKFDKAPNETFIVQYTKRKNFMPASCSYDQMRGLKITTQGFWKGYK